MKKIEKLTDKQVELMHKHRDNWINFVLNSDKDLTRQEIEDDIEWIYSKIGLKKPLILIAESYLTEKLMQNFVFLYF